MLPDDREGAPELFRLRYGDRFGSIAERALDAGRGADAEQLLGRHLRSVLAGTEQGADVPAGRIERAALYGAWLAESMRQGRWLDFSVKLLAAARAPPASDELVGALERAARTVGSFDSEALWRYVHLINYQSATVELEVVRRIDRLERAALGSRGRG